ncbi:MAG: hypothetical protein ABIK89_24600 [Planctomycetota bacterium]
MKTLEQRSREATATLAIAYLEQLPRPRAAAWAAADAAQARLDAAIGLRTALAADAKDARHCMPGWRPSRVRCMPVKELAECLGEYEYMITVDGPRRRFLGHADGTNRYLYRAGCMGEGYLVVVETSDLADFAGNSAMWAGSAMTRAEWRRAILTAIAEYPTHPPRHPPGQEGE